MPQTLVAKPWHQSSFPAQGSALTAVLFAAVVVASLYFGREVSVPIALAVLMSFVLSALSGVPLSQLRSPDTTNGTVLRRSCLAGTELNL